MESQALLRYQLDNGGFQVRKVFEGATDSTLDLMPAPEGMTGRDIVEHLADCYNVAFDLSQGREARHGSLQIEDKSVDGLMSKMWELRDRAVEAVLASDDDRLQKIATDYILLHDAYHVGQMCLVRVRENPDWDIYSIYQ